MEKKKFFFVLPPDLFPADVHNTNLQTCTGSAAFTIRFLVHDSAQDVDANGLRCPGEGRE